MSGRRSPLGTAQGVDVLRDFGQRLRWLREAWEWREPGCHSQRQWAKYLGVANTAVSRWEAGLVPMPFDLMWRVVFAMDATWDYLFGGLIGPGMEPWLQEYLLEHHPKDLVHQPVLRTKRAEWRAAYMALTRTPRRTRGPRKTPLTAA